MARLDNPKDPEAAIVAVEPQTGFVRAIIGGRNWDASQVNLALGRLGGGSGRQAGSSFKPFVLATAFEHGFTPDKKYRGPSSVRPRGFDKPVHNYGGQSYGWVDLRTATQKSINTVFAQLIADVGVRPTAELALRLGIKGIDLNHKLYGVLAIGTQETSPLEMASAYGVFANHGVKVEPTPVLRILDVHGGTVEDNRQPNGQRVLSEAVADNVTAVLQGVIEKGTGRRADIGRPAAGKTGTSENWENAWFVGYTPTLSTAVWMGYPRANVSMANVHGVDHVVGGSLPSMIWHDFMAEAVKDVPPLAFSEAAPLPSRAQLEAKARIVAEQHLTFFHLHIACDDRAAVGAGAAPVGQGAADAALDPTGSGVDGAAGDRASRQEGAAVVIDDHDVAAPVVAAAAAPRAAAGPDPGGLTSGAGRIAPHAASARAAGPGRRTLKGWTVPGRRPPNWSTGCAAPARSTPRPSGGCRPSSAVPGGGPATCGAWPSTIRPACSTCPCWRRWTGAPPRSGSPPAS